MINTIESAVHFETQAWNKKSIRMLFKLFHRNFVWVWPRDNLASNPENWERPLGKFNRSKWNRVYSDLFLNNDLLRNERKIVKICVEPGGKSGFAVVDIDTVWENKKSKTKMIWQGRTCKTYIKTFFGYKLISHYGVIRY